MENNYGFYEEDFYYCERCAFHGQQHGTSTAEIPCDGTRMKREEFEFYLKDFPDALEFVIEKYYK